jgi:two-component system chemotaxis response regulator CheV
MTGMIERVNQRTQMVGQNRLELLLFSMEGNQLFGINVFKVKEVLPCPKLTHLPNSTPEVRGVAHVRGQTIPIIDIRMATGGLPMENISHCHVIVTEYNKVIQGFLVSSVDRIVNLNWDIVHAPPEKAGKENYLIAVSQIGDQLVEILDVEKILFQLTKTEPNYRSMYAFDFQAQQKALGLSLKVLIADDSSVARKQLLRCLEPIGLDVVAFEDGQKTLNHLQEMIAQGKNPMDEYLMLISDIEMPEMDGYTLVSSIRGNAEMRDMFIILHSSLSGVFNEAMVKKAGANEFIAKFEPARVIDLVANRFYETTGLKLLKDESL